MTAISLRQLSVSLPAGASRRLAIADVSLDVRRGETLAIIGASGSGKSVLASAMLAALAPGLAVVAGSVCLGTTDLADLGEGALRRLRGNRIALIPQEPTAALNPLMTVGGQIAEVLLIHGAGTTQAGRIDALLAAVALPPALAGRFPHQLSGGECQRVAIAMAIAMAPEVLIADEATTALDTVTQSQILQLFAALRRRAGHALVFVSHDIAVVAGIADRIAVMDDGRIVEIGTAQAILASPQHRVTQALVAARSSTSLRIPRATGPSLLQVRDVSKAYGDKAVLAAISLYLAAGETLAIVGASGSGKSTLARVIMKLIPADHGSVVINGSEAVPRGALQMVFQNAAGAFNPRRSVGSAIARAAALAGASPAAARDRAEDLLIRVGLDRDAAARLPAAFSGGQRQRIGIARALAMDPQILICDESVSGLDPVTRQQILLLLADVQSREGVAIMFITHDLRVAAAIADRIAVIDAGQIVETGSAAAVLSAPQSNAGKALVAAMPGGYGPDLASSD